MTALQVFGVRLIFCHSKCFAGSVILGQSLCFAVPAFFHVVAHFDHIVPFSFQVVSEGTVVVSGTKVKWCLVALPPQVQALIKAFALVVILTISDVPPLALSPPERVHPCLPCCCLQLPSVAFIKLILCTQPFSVYSSYSKRRSSLWSRDVLLFLTTSGCLCLCTPTQTTVSYLPFGQFTCGLCYSRCYLPAGLSLATSMSGQVVEEVQGLGRLFQPSVSFRKAPV